MLLVLLVLLVFDGQIMQIGLTPVQLVVDPIFKRHVLGNSATGQYEELLTE